MNHNDSGSAAQLPPNLALQSIEAHPLEFTGSGGEYFRVWIVNVLLGILTLGFYTPWARRRTAQYFYDHSMVAGSPLEFTAQQRKMVMGFVMLVLLTVAYNIAAESGQDTAVALFLLAGAVLAPFIWASAMRFRLGATRWRGLRLQFTASWREVYTASWPVFALALVWMAVVFGLQALAPEVAQAAPGLAGEKVRKSLPAFTAPMGALLALGLVLSLLCIIRLEYNYKSLLVLRAHLGTEPGRWKPVYMDFVKIWLATVAVFIVSALAMGALLAALAGGSFALLRFAAMSYTAQDILNTLDATGLDDMPMFDAGTAFIAPRLDIFRDDAHWAIVFNMVGWDQDVHTHVYPLGPRMRMHTWMGYLNAQHGDWQANAEQQLRAHADDPFALAQAMIEGHTLGTGFVGEQVQQLQDIHQHYHQSVAPSGPSEDDKFLHPGELEIDYVSDDALENGLPVAASVRGQPIDAAELAELQRLARSNQSEGIAPSFVIAFIQKHHEQLWARPEEMAIFFEGGLPPHFMTLTEWETPDVSGEQKPGSMPSWQSLAQAIAQNDRSAYQAGPPNTDWRRWENL
ncbi:UNVERIFIED_CONTAM: uncharacterized protein DUF898 [Acidovorax defluvii]